MNGYLRYYCNKSINEVKSILNKDEIILGYWSNSDNTKNNWGDALNPWLVKKISGKKLIHRKNVLNLRKNPVYCNIGSTLDHLNYNNSVIWGAGFKNPKSKLRINPKEIHLVRGPLTRKLIINSGYDCPTNYGDPGLLVSNYYNPKILKKYSIGIIPHYVDYNLDLLEGLKKDKEVNIINIKSGIKNVINEALKCEIIASSSLHGLILATSYGIPSTWIKLSNKVFGGDFKFKDYYYSLNVNKIKPLIFNDEIIKNKIVKSSFSVPFSVERSEKILSNCPFI